MKLIETAITRAARYLISKQDARGVWRDYADMPIGSSDVWVTAFVGRFLAKEHIYQLVPESRQAAMQAGICLREYRSYPVGFGYNADSGPDADSTAHAIALLQQLGFPLEQNDLLWLLKHWLPNGGCTTYQRQDAWGVAHTCVTPVAWLSLPPSLRLPLSESVLDFIHTCEAPDGTWPAYWWRGRHYSTFWNRRALLELGKSRQYRTSILTQDIKSAFDLAYSLGITVLDGKPDKNLLTQLIATQAPDGSWRGAANLRLTHPDCFRPWIEPHGNYYIDRNHLITTATVIDVLSLLLT